VADARNADRLSGPSDEGTAAIDSYLRTHHNDLIRLLDDLVRIDSQIPPHADERQISEFLHGRMGALDLGEIETFAAAPERPNLVARIRGTGGGRTLVLNGHLDTKPVGEAQTQWVSDPHVPAYRNGRMYGLGTADMKGAVAAMVFAAAALRASGLQLGGDLVLAFSADEEAGASMGSRFLAPLLEGVDACLIGEPSGWDRNWQGICLVCRGVCCFRIRVRGTQGHSSLTDLGPSVNASLQMAELLVAIKTGLHLDFPVHPLGRVEPTLNPGVLVSGGVYFGVVPGVAEFACDLRTVPGMTEDGVRMAIERWLDTRRQMTPGLDVEVEFEPGLNWVPPAEISPDHALVHVTQAAAAEVLGSAPPPVVFPGGTDAPWFEAAGIPAIPSFGPGLLSCCHGPNEYVEIESVYQAARMYARIAARYCMTQDRR
jgi:acetylornithine deacetylase/succinyl-diaminopimelate desuccinylase family protein